MEEPNWKEIAIAHTDDEDCDLDHHGSCQAHDWFGEGPCPNGVVRKWLEQNEQAS